MTDIDVPDWVVDEALFCTPVHDGDELAMPIDLMNFGSPEMLDRARSAMRAAITAALGAWVVTGGYQSRLIAKRTGNLVNDWRKVDKELFDAVGGNPHEGTDFRCEYRTVYTLRQEKPE